jgi:uncharacterized protein YbaP (TraB family)
MRRQIIVIFLSLFFFVLAPASGADRGALFKVAGSGHTMYLFGTMHVGLPEFYPLESRISSAVSSASALALEIDPTQDPAAMARAIQQQGTYGPGSALYQDMTPAMRGRLEKVLQRARIDPAAVAGLKPWLVATVLAVAEYAAQGYRPDLSVDMHLAQLARASKVPVIELESVSSQLDMFNRLSSAAQWRVLEECISMIESGKQSGEVQMIVDAWRSADKAGLDAIARRAEADDSVSGKFVQEVMLEERNVKLADKLAQLLAQKNNSVAAIGVLHLIGKNSVPVLLRARGVTVERVY